MNIIDYDRDAAVAYAAKWALSRNPAFYSFDHLGGDCTNFASQCLYAGCGVMNNTPVTGWYYHDANNRTASWTGVEYLYRFLTKNQGVGPFGVAVTKSEVLPGDLVQLGGADGRFYHSPVVLSADGHEIFVAAHNLDSLWRPLSSYVYQSIRYIHVGNARR